MLKITGFEFCEIVWEGQPILVAAIRSEDEQGKPFVNYLSADRLRRTLGEDCIVSMIEKEREGWHR